MPETGRRMTAANLLTAFRLLAAPVMLWLAFAGQATHFLWLVCASFASDAADGFVARWSGGATVFGSRLDSLADAVCYTVIGVSVLLLFPHIVARELWVFLLLLASLVLPAIAGLAKYGQLTSYHTWLVKLAVGTAALGLVLLLLDITSWPFRIAAVLGVLAAIEQVALTMRFKEPRSDVASIFLAGDSRAT